MPWSTDSRHARGYGTDWDKRRKRVLERDKYLCQPCMRKGRYEPASQVDHIISKAEWMRKHGNLVGCDDDSNLQSISLACHKDKTMRENGATPRRVIAANGWPTCG